MGTNACELTSSELAQNSVSGGLATNLKQCDICSAVNKQWHFMPGSWHRRHTNFWARLDTASTCVSKQDLIAFMLLGGLLNSIQEQHKRFTCHARPIKACEHCENAAVTISVSNLDLQPALITCSSARPWSRSRAVCLESSTCVGGRRYCTNAVAS